MSSGFDLISAIRPRWWSRARCRGEGSRWTVERGRPRAEVLELVAICAGRPVAGECLRDAFAMDRVLRRRGPVRAGVSSGREWDAMELAVAVLQPVTDADWDDLAVLWLDKLLVRAGRDIELVADLSA